MFFFKQNLTAEWFLLYKVSCWFWDNLYWSYMSQGVSMNVVDIFKCMLYLKPQEHINSWNFALSTTAYKYKITGIELYYWRQAVVPNMDLNTKSHMSSTCFSCKSHIRMVIKFQTEFFVFKKIKRACNINKMSHSSFENYLSFQIQNKITGNYLKVIKNCFYKPQHVSDSSSNHLLQSFFSGYFHP